MAPPTNPYRRPAAAAAAVPRLQNGVSQSTMGPQSQRRLSLKERAHQLQASSHRKKHKTGGQQTLFGDRAFDPLKDCEVCRAKEYGRSVHRAHHERCVNNRRTRGFSNAALALANEEARLKRHFATPLSEAEKCRGEYATPEAAAAFFAPREGVTKIAGKITTTTTQITTTTQFAATVASESKCASEQFVSAAELCTAVTELVTDVDFLEKHKGNKAPMAMLAFASVVMKTIVRNNRVHTASHFDGLTITVPRADNSDNPQHHSIVGQKLLLVDWIMMYGLDNINCPCCKASSMENDRTNFSKNKILFPIFVMEGPPLWCMVQSMVCPCCRYRTDANVGELLCLLPAYARNSYPVETKYCFDNKNAHIGRTATTVLDLLMTTCGNGDLCSRLLYNAINRSYLERVENYYSLPTVIKKEGGALPYVDKDGGYITTYPPLGDGVRGSYDAACSSNNNPVAN